MLAFGDMAEKLIFWQSQHKIMTIFGILVRKVVRTFQLQQNFRHHHFLCITYKATFNLKCLVFGDMAENLIFWVYSKNSDNS